MKVKALLYAAFVIGLTSIPQSATATTAGFSPNQIMSDAVMTNHNSMNANDIQVFLNSKVPTCDTNGQQNSEFGGPDLNGDGRVQRWEWGQSRYGQSTFTCLKDYSEGGKSSAQIIYDVGKKYSINPQSLIVLLQKEQGLVTDTWPLNLQYRSATGYGCPDTAPCDSQYYGLTNQLDWAAKMFRSIINQSPGWYSPYFKGSNPRVYWHPDTARCGSAPLEIANWTTAALYSYTPYRPNQAALNAGYGMGDSCSSYGNRNFYSYFTDWFGSATGGDYNWSVVSLTIYDESKSVQIPTDYLRPGDRLLASLKVRNDSGITWDRDGATPTLLGTDNPRDRFTGICDATWLKCTRVARLVESSVAPGAEGHFEFYFSANNTIGEYRDYLTPVVENQGWMSKSTGFHLYSRTVPEYSWRWDSVTAWRDEEQTIPMDLNNVARGEKIYINLSVKNTSATTWLKSGASPLRLGTSEPKDRTSTICDSTWLGCNRLATVNQASVAPGQDASFSFGFIAPSKLGAHREYVRPLVENKGWMTADYNHIYLNVTR